MLIEIIVYLGLFALIFTGAFGAAFETVDTLHILEQKQEILEAKSFLQNKLDFWLEESTDWVVGNDGVLSFNKKSELSDKHFLFLKNNRLYIDAEPLSSTELFIKNFSVILSDSATSSAVVLSVKIDISTDSYVFSYYEEK